MVALRVGASALPLSAAVSYSSPGATYLQNFDALASAGANNGWANDATLTGWYWYDSNAATPATYAAADGSGSLQNVPVSLGSAVASDRALGSQSPTSGGIPPATIPPNPIRFGMVVRNNTGQTLTGLTLSYAGEQWREPATNSTSCETGGDNLTVDYQMFSSGASLLAATGWIGVSALTFTCPNAPTATAAQFGGNISTNRVLLSATITNLNWAAGQDLVIRWTDRSNTSVPQQFRAMMGVDDVIFSATTNAPALPPSIASALPKQLPAGVSQSMTVIGSNFQSGATVALSPVNPGITISNVQFINSTNLTLTLALASTASPGPQGFTVTNPDDQSAIGSVLFNILSPPPSVTEVTPNAFMPGSSQTLTVKGAGFQSGAMLTFLPADATGLTIGNVVTVNTSNISLTLTVATNAGSGMRGFIVTNPDSRSAASPSLFNVMVPPNQGPVHVDHCIYGGTGAGVMAAVQAARMGKTVALLEPGQHLGGINVEGLGGTDIDNHSDFQNSGAVGGLALEFYQRISDHYGRRAQFDAMLATHTKNTSLWDFEPYVAEAVMDEIVSVPRIMVYRGHRLAETNGITKDPVTKRLTALRTENGAEFQARMFIDATIEGDLLAAAGVSTIIGRESNATYGETENGIRTTNTYAQFAVSVDPYKIPGDTSSGLIATIQDEPLGNDGEGDARIQAYCFRMVLTTNATNRISFAPPAAYDPANYEIYRRYAAAGGQLWKPGVTVPNSKTDMGSWHDLSANLYGMNHAYPGGDYATRARIYQEHLDFTQGLCWFLANDPAVPADVRGEWARWGVCRDEFQDNGGWPRQLYVRDARRMVSDYVITQSHTRLTGQTPVPDPVGMAFWPPDTHHVRRIVQNGAAYNEGFVYGNSAGSDWAPFGVSYRALVPRSNECVNLLTPTCPSSSHVAYGAIRIEWTFMVLGQSAATAACFAMDDNLAVQRVDYAKLQTQLRADNQVLALAATDGIIVDNADTDRVTLVGSWTSSAYVPGFIGTNYLHDGGGSNKTYKSITFTPALTNGGEYEVYALWSADSNRADNVPIDIVAINGTNTVVVNQQANSQVWTLLGTFPFAAGTNGSVTIRNDGTVGYVIADAIRFLNTDSNSRSSTVSVVATDPDASVDGTNTACVTFVRSGGTNLSLAVAFTLGGTASNGVDCVALPGTIQMPAGVIATNLLITALGNNNVQGLLTIVLTIQPGTNYLVGTPSNATVRVLDFPSNTMLPLVLKTNGILVRFAQISGENCEVQLATSLLGPWMTLTNIVVAPPGIAEYLDTNPPPFQGFYRTSIVK